MIKQSVLEQSAIKQSAIKQSTIGFQFGCSASKADLAAQLPQAPVCPRGCQQLQTDPDGLRDAGPAGLLRLLQQNIGDFHGDLARCCHNEINYTISNTSTDYGVSRQHNTGTGNLRVRLRVARPVNDRRHKVRSFEGESETQLPHAREKWGTDFLIRSQKRVILMKAVHASGYGVTVTVTELEVTVVLPLT